MEIPPRKRRHSRSIWKENGLGFRHIRVFHPESPSRRLRAWPPQPVFPPRRDPGLRMFPAEIPQRDALRRMPGLLQPGVVPGLVPLGRLIEIARINADPRGLVSDFALLIEIVRGGVVIEDLSVRTSPYFHNRPQKPTTSPSLARRRLWPAVPGPPQWPWRSTCEPPCHGPSDRGPPPERCWPEQMDAAATSLRYN